DASRTLPTRRSSSAGDHECETDGSEQRRSAFQCEPPLDYLGRAQCGPGSAKKQCLQSLGDVAQLDRVGERAQLLQALVLDLPDALTSDVERPPDLVERPWMLAVEPVPQLEHLTFTTRERAEDLPQRLLAHRDLGFFVRQGKVLVGDEV